MANNDVTSSINTSWISKIIPKCLFILCYVRAGIDFVNFRLGMLVQGSGKTRDAKVATCVCVYIPTSRSI